MKDSIFKKEYMCIYLGKACYNFGNGLVESFGTVMLYKGGIPIWLILLIYGLRFGIMGMSSPLFMTLSSTLGIAGCLLVSNILSIISSYMVLDSANIFNHIILFILVMGLAGITNPSLDALSSKYVEKEHKGRFNGFVNISKVIAHAISGVITAWGVVTNNNFIVFIILSIAFLLEYVFIKPIDYKTKKRPGIIKDSMHYIIHSKSRYKIIYALRTNHVIERQFVALYLFIALKDFTAFSSVVVISLTIQVISLLIIGHFSDKNRKMSNNVVSVIKMCITGFFLIARNKFLIAVNKTLNDNFQKVYETTIFASIQNIIKDEKEDSDLLATIGQMVLCFTEVIVFIILAIIAKFFGDYVFYVIFILSMASSILMNTEIQKEMKMKVKS